MAKPKLPHKMYLVLGDWSEDGHGKCDKILIGSNKTVKQIQNAYKASCKLTGVQFNENQDYTEQKRHWQEESKFRIAVEYESGLEIPPEAAKALKAHGLKIPKHVLANESDDPQKDFISLWFNFVQLSLPDLRYEVLQDEIPTINGYWDKNLNVQFGYGLF